MHEFGSSLGERAILVALTLALGGCGEGPAPAPLPAPAEASEIPASAIFASELEASALPLAELRERAGQAAVEAGRSRAAQGGIEQARAAAGMLRVLALRTGDSGALEQARLHLEGAAEGAGPEPCGAALQLVRLEARDLASLEGAAERARRASERNAEAAPDCAAALRRIARSLGGATSPSGALGGEDGAPAGGTLDAISIFASGGGAARVVLRLDRPLAFERDELAARGDLPRRLYVDLPGVRAAPSVPPRQPVGVAGLSQVRHAEHGPGGLRVVFDLDSNAEYRFFYLTAPARIIVDVSSGATPIREASDGLALIVLDPGHGGDDFGARFEGLTEAELVLDIARRAAASLRRRLPRTRVVLTRDVDTFLTLEERIAMANGLGADVFVSIHLNGSEEPIERGGVTTFVLDTSNDRQALRLAARENGTSTAEVSELERILAGLHRREQARGSRRLAERLHRSTLAAGRRVFPGLSDRGVRSAMFYVLVGARMPALLLEASFLTHSEDARALRSPRYRESLGDGIAEGIVGYAAASSGASSAP